MKKSMFSLILSTDVVQEVDRLAELSHTNRSNYINQILAEHCAFLTPEKKIGNIFRRMNALIDESLETSFDGNDYTLFAKSILNYKYRPSMNYSVELYHTAGGALGELRVSSRSQSEELLRGLERFFRLMAEMERIYLTRYFKDKEIQFDISEGRMSRVFRLPETEDEQELSEAISAYVNLFDKLLKGYIAGEIGARQMEEKYVEYLNSGHAVI